VIDGQVPGAARAGSRGQAGITAEEAAKASGLPADGKGQEQASANLAKALKVEKIDWDKQMVVAVTAGQKPTGGYQIDIQSITTAGKDATVMWKLTAPQGIAIQVLTHPSVMVLVDRAAGEVKFDPAIK
jgi:hypothetical protein